MKKTNLFENIPKDLPDELIEVLASNKDIRIERIISKGHQSPEDSWYDQEQDEFVLLLKGKAELEFSRSTSEKVMLEEGDSILINAGQKHRVSWTSSNIETIWLAVFY